MPNIIITGASDGIGAEMARLLGEAGVPTVITRFAGMNHGFLFWVGIVGGADAAMAEACAWARQVFAKKG